MHTFRRLKWFVPVLAILTGCIGDDPIVDNPEGPQGSGTMEEMTHEQSKEFLQNTATEFLDHFNPQDQKDIIELAAYYSREYGELEAPVEFEIGEGSRADRTPASYLKALSRAAEGDLDALSRAALSYSYTIKFDRFTGIYEPDIRKKRWVKTGNSKDIVFKFTDISGKPVEMKATQSGDTSELDFYVDDCDWEYVNGHWNEYEVRYNYYLSIPKTVEVTLSDNGKQLVKTKAVASINIDNHTFSAEVNVTAMNLDAYAVTNGTDSKIEARTEFKVSSVKIADSYATVNGSDLCNKKMYESLSDMDDDAVEIALAKMLKSGDCGANILDKVQAYGQIEYYLNFPSDIGFYADDYFDKTAAQKACKQACDRLNNYIKTQIRFNKTATDQASLSFIPGYYGGSWYWKYYPTACLLFPDGTSYNIESYFENFTNVTNKFNLLMNAYENVWRIAGGTPW